MSLIFLNLFIISMNIAAFSLFIAFIFGVTGFFNKSNKVQQAKQYAVASKGVLIACLLLLVGVGSCLTSLATNT